jgi:hypothetical protein
MLGPTGRVAPRNLIPLLLPHRLELGRRARDGSCARDLRRGGGARGGHAQGARDVPAVRRPGGGHRRGERAAHPVPAAVPQEQAQVLLHQVLPPPRHPRQLISKYSSTEAIGPGPHAWDFFLPARSSSLRPRPRLRQIPSSSSANVFFAFRPFGSCLVGACT